MMQIHTKKALDEVLATLQSGRLKQALDMLMKLVRDRFSGQHDLINAVIGVCARYNHLHRRMVAGVLAESEARIAENQIRFSTLELIEIMKEALAGPDSELQPETPTIVNTQKSRILFFAANPSGQVGLQVGEEVRRIRQALAQANLSDRFELITEFATRPEDFLQKILSYKPEFVHFAGHGEVDGLFMVNRQGRATLLPAQRAASIFELFRDVVACVVLNACHSAEQAKLIARYIPHVIGTSRAVGDETAMTFAALFYTAVAEGSDIPFAFEFARLGVDLNDLGQDLFHLHSR